MAQVTPLVLLADGTIARVQSGDYIATAALGSGTADSTTFLRGDNTWATPSGSSVTLAIVGARALLKL